MKTLLTLALLILSATLASACPDTAAAAGSGVTVTFTVTGPKFNHVVSASFPNPAEAALALDAGFNVGKILIDWPAHAHAVTTAGDSATVTLLAASPTDTKNYSATFLTTEVANLTARRVCGAIEKSMITK